jgi:hypothetical protein
MACVLTKYVASNSLVLFLCIACIMKRLYSSTKTPCCRIITFIVLRNIKCHISVFIIQFSNFISMVAVIDSGRVYLKNTGSSSMAGSHLYFML